MLGGKRVTLVAAMARNRAIGQDGAMPWHLPRELKHFEATTLGHPIVMGRKTWESIGRALPGRQNIVVTRDPGYRAEGCDVVGSLEAAMAVAAGDEVMVIGGGQLYAQAQTDFGQAPTGVPDQVTMLRLLHGDAERAAD